jgi:pimeloyl-ACP methyl ester carboxylesterase
MRADRLPAIVMLVLLAACSGAEPPKATGPSSTGPSPASTTPAAVADPAAHPSIDDAFTIAAGGRQLRLVCWGTGTPTVLLETGGANIEEWTGSGIVHELASRTRVCTYDRAGSGTSDAAPDKRRDADDTVTEAHALLEAAHVDGPLVLLGRSFGGMIVTHYADVLPEDVVGVVVLDTPAPSAEFTEENEPGLVWDAPGNTEHLDVVHGFENRFANHPPHVDAPLLLITPVPGEGSVKNERFWLQTSRQAKQVRLACGEEPTEGPCATEVATFVESLDMSDN